MRLDLSFSCFFVGMLAACGEKSQTQPADTGTGVATDSETDEGAGTGTDSGDETSRDTDCQVTPPAREPGFLWFSGYELEPWDDEWGLRWDQETNHEITSDDVLFGERAARVTYPQGTYSSEGGAQYLLDFALLESPIPNSDEMYVRYYLKFDEGTDFIKGGKLPGFRGGEGNTGGNPPDGYDGWSARIMWRANGRIVQYVYHADQAGEYGDDFDWNEGGASRFFIPGKWHCVETYIKMNTVDGEGEENAAFDGVVRSWLDGELALNRTDVRFRYTNDFSIDGFYFSTFFGGGDETWAPLKDEHAMFDNFVIDEEPIGCHDDCIIPPYSAPGPQSVTEASATLVFNSDDTAWDTGSWGLDNSGVDFDSSLANHTEEGQESAYIKFSPTDWDESRAVWGAYQRP